MFYIILVVGLVTQDLPSQQFEVEKLLASDGEAYEGFGRSVSVSGNVSVVGAQLDDDNGIDSGSAYIFDLTMPFQLVSTNLLQSGQVASFQVTDGARRKRIWLIYSLTGGSCMEDYPPLNVTFSVCHPSAHPGNPIRTGVTDANGDITWTIAAPVVTLTTPVWFQAVQKDQITPVVHATIEP